LALLLAAGAARKVCQEHDVIRLHHRRTIRLLFYKLFRIRPIYCGVKRHC
jgi:hypothetical protein